MAHIVLVHGMLATKRSWNTLPKHLKSAGHTVTNLTLPGHANPFEYLSTDMEEYVDDVAEALANAGGAHLVGHSMGGFVISRTAAAHANLVHGLVYVAAMLPNDGDTIKGLATRTGTSLRDIREEFSRAGVSAIGALGMQPFGPMDDPMIDAATIAELPRHYVRCSEDRIIPPRVQDEMLANWVGTTTTDLTTGHLPQYTRPNELAAAVLSVIG